MRHTETAADRGSIQGAVLGISTSAIQNEVLTPDAALQVIRDRSSDRDGVTYSGKPDLCRGKITCSAEVLRAMDAWKIAGELLSGPCTGANAAQWDEAKERALAAVGDVIELQEVRHAAADALWPLRGDQRVYRMLWLAHRTDNWRPKEQAALEQTPNAEYAVQYLDSRHEQRQNRLDRCMCATPYAYLNQGIPHGEAVAAARVLQIVLSRPFEERGSELTAHAVRVLKNVARQVMQPREVSFAAADALFALNNPELRGFLSDLHHGAGWRPEHAAYFRKAL